MFSPVNKITENKENIMEIKYGKDSLNILRYVYGDIEHSDMYLQRKYNIYIEADRKEKERIGYENSEEYKTKKIEYKTEMKRRKRIRQQKSNKKYYQNNKEKISQKAKERYQLKKLKSTQDKSK